MKKETKKEEIKEPKEVKPVEYIEEDVDEYEKRVKPNIEE